MHFIWEDWLIYFTPAGRTITRTINALMLWSVWTSCERWPETAQTVSHYLTCQTQRASVVEQQTSVWNISAERFPPLLCLQSARCSLINMRCSWHQTDAVLCSRVRGTSKQTLLSSKCVICLHTFKYTLQLLVETMKRWRCVAAELQGNCSFLLIFFNFIETV